MTAAQRAYYERNREKVIAASRARRLADPEAYNAYFRAWRKKNRAKVTKLQQARRAAKGRATRGQVEARVAFYGGRCRYCGVAADTIDHRIPLSRGGTGLPANLVPACFDCNRRKRAKTEREFLDAREAA